MSIVANGCQTFFESVGPDCREREICYGDIQQFNVE